jgi:hypothetical protein
MRVLHVPRAMLPHLGLARVIPVLRVSTVQPMEYVYHVPLAISASVELTSAQYVPEASTLWPRRRHVHHVPLGSTKDRLGSRRVLRVPRGRTVEPVIVIAPLVVRVNMLAQQGRLHVWPVQRARKRLPLDRLPALTAMLIHTLQALEIMYAALVMQARLQLQALTRVWLAPLACTGAPTGPAVPRAPLDRTLDQVLLRAPCVPLDTSREQRVRTSALPV